MDIKNCTFDKIEVSDVHSFSIWRWDKLNKDISGNKWFKLLGHEEVMIQNAFTTVITFGGAFSNHLYAVAHFCRIKNYKAVLIIRGEELTDGSNDTIMDLKNLGADIHFVSREDYVLKQQSATVENIMFEYKNFHIIPEGGEGELGERGFQVLRNSIPDGITHVCVSIGTGTTLKGLRRIIPDHVRILGFSSFKSLKHQFSEHWLEDNNVELTDCSGSGRFGHFTPELISFMNAFYRDFDIPIDIVYTGKMFQAIFNMLKNGSFSDEDSILAIHTGGLQGNRSISHLLNY